MSAYLWARALVLWVVVVYFMVAWLTRHAPSWRYPAQGREPVHRRVAATRPPAPLPRQTPPQPWAGPFPSRHQPWTFLLPVCGPAPGALGRGPELRFVHFTTGFRLPGMFPWSASWVAGPLAGRTLLWVQTPAFAVGPLGGRLGCLLVLGAAAAAVNSRAEAAATSPKCQEGVRCFCGWAAFSNLQSGTQRQNPERDLVALSGCPLQVVDSLALGAMLSHLFTPRERLWKEDAMPPARLPRTLGRAQPLPLAAQGPL